jgi:tetratricopeptide (TPR) repeat protein
MWLAAAFLVLLLNTAYLTAFATPSLIYFANIGVHVVLGVVLSVWFVGWLRATRSVSGWLLASAALLLTGALFGIAIVYWGATRPYRWLLHAHIGFSTAGATFVLSWLASTAWRLPNIQRRRLGLASVALVAVSALVAIGLRAGHDERRADRHRIANPVNVPLSMDEEGAGPASPFFPSSAETDVGRIIPANFFLTSQACGRCHADIYEQWNSSAHHFSSLNNQWYRKSIEYMQDVVGTKPSRWCAGCHDHAVFFNGRFDRPIREQIDTPEAQAGLACTSCHAVTHVKSTMGQGDFVIEYPPLHDLAASERPALRYIHDKLLEIDPQPHRETFLKPFHREQTAEFCSSCHKVHLDVPVNGYRWFRGFNDYDNWQASGVSGQGARSFYYPAAPQKCADCHMPLVASNDPAARDGKVRSHRFPGANTALPFANRDAVQLRTVQEFLRDGQISVDIFGLIRGDAPSDGIEGRRPATGEQSTASTFAVGEESLNFGATESILLPPAEVLAPLGLVDAAVRRGESVRLEVVVRTRKVGHFFPGGTVDAFDVWVELEAVDDRGRALFHSGQVSEDGRGPVEPGAHFYRALLLDERGNPINKRNAFAARSVAYVRLIPPGAADTIHYRLRIPADAGDRIRIRAKVNYRKFAWWNTQWAYAGVRDPAQGSFGLAAGYDDGRWVFTGETSKVSGQVKAIPDIPTTVMAEGEATLRVVPAGTALPPDRPHLDRSVRERWNDYGIGLLLQGDIKGAEAAFLKVTAIDPGYADGWVNVGRARVLEGNMSAAEEVLRQALKVDPRLASAHFFIGLALKSQGRYDEALDHFRSAAARYPRDRVVRNQLGRVLFLKREFRTAVEELRKVLEIDPEDLQAHYNLMLAYQGLGKRALADRERRLYERFKADESSQAITGPYRQLHPDDNNERQQIHEHRSVGDRPPAGRPPARIYSVSDSAGGAAHP